MNSRQIIALLAAAAAVPPAAAAECVRPEIAVPRAASAEPAERIDVEGPDELPVQVKSRGGAEVTREGDAKFTGGVSIVRGEREVSAESATYDASEQRFEVEGDVEYRSPDLRLKGGSGSWNALGTGRFTGAEFELPQRPARGSAAELEMTGQGVLQLRDVRFTTCPAGNTDWELKASSIEIDQKTQQGKGQNVRVDLKGVPILYTPVISFP
ncbi:MAG: LptA/OstA family protein, partial [Steroidobacteraceae bacterium]